MDNTILQQGRFTSTGNSVTIQLRSDVDWMAVYNVTQAAAAQTVAVGVKYFWARGFASGAKWTSFKSNAVNAANLEQYITSNGFTLVDSSSSPYGVLNATITAISSAAIPVVSNSGVNGLVAGDIVRLTNVTGAHQISGMDFTVGYNTLSAGTFSLDYMSQIVAATTGEWSKIKFNPLYYPAQRVITKITQASQAVVTFSVTHGFKVGQVIRFHGTSAFGMSEISGLSGTIVAVDTTTTTGNSVTVDIDSTAFSPFVFALTADVPFDFPLATPVGENTAAALGLGVDILTDATVNTGYIGMVLAGGVNCPGGAAADVVYWVAGKSFSIANA